MPRLTVFHRWLRGAAPALAAVALFSARTGAQENRESPQSSAAEDSRSSPAGPLDVRGLADAVAALQDEIRSLRSQVDDLRSQQAQSLLQVRDLQEQLLRARGNASSSSANFPGGLPTPAQANLSATPMNSSSSQDAAQKGDLSDRVSGLQEGQDLLNAHVVEQSQTKIESGSKYRVRFSGILLMNLFANRGGVDNQDFPENAVEVNQPLGANTFSASLRQSQFGVEAFGPVIGGARSSAAVSFDFAGGFPQDTPNGQTMGIIRLRTAVARFDWERTSLVAGQDRLFFAPLTPTSISSLAVPALSYAGNLWGWTPQIRVERRLQLTDKSSLLLQAGILDSLSGDQPSESQDAEASWGEQSGQPAYAARLSWTRPLFGQNLTLGTGGYYGRQFWGFSRNVDGWAGTVDISVPLNKTISLTAAFYRGRAVAGLGGALDQDVVMSGSFFSPVTVIKGLDAVGGWMQLKFQARPYFQINAAYGQDNPYASELDRFPNTYSYSGYLLTRNQSPMVNFIFQPRSDVDFSIEYRRLKTMVFRDDTRTADHYSASIGYKF